MRRHRGWRLLAVLVVLGLVMSACGSGGDRKLRYMIWDPHQAVGYKKVIDEFEKRIPGIKVQLEVVPWGSYWTKLYTQVAAGSAPDVFWGMPSYLTELVQKNAVADESDLVRKTDSSGFLIPELQNAFTLDGKAYGVQKDWDALGYAYNADLLAKAGVTGAPSLDWNPRDGGTFLSLMKRLTTDQNGKHADEPGFDTGKIKTYGFAYFNSNTDPSDLSPWIYSNGGQIVDSDGKLVIDSPQNAATLGFLADLINKYHVAPQYRTLLSSTPFALYAGKRVAVWQTGPWEVTTLAQQTGFASVYGQTAAGDRGSFTRSNGLMDCIFAKSAQSDTAKEFVRYIASDEAQDVLGKSGTVLFPATKAGTEHAQDYWNDKGIDTRAFSVAAHAEGQVVTDPVVSNYSEFATLFQKTIGQVLSGQTSPAAGLSQLQQQGSAVLARS
jgi:multiple sugar transport system substrate-binding protein